MNEIKYYSIGIKSGKYVLESLFVSERLKHGGVHLDGVHSVYGRISNRELSVMYGNRTKRDVRAFGRVCAYMKNRRKNVRSEYSSKFVLNTD